MMRLHGYRPKTWSPVTSGAYSAVTSEHGFGFTTARIRIRNLGAATALIYWTAADAAAGVNGILIPLTADAPPLDIPAAATSIWHTSAGTTLEITGFDLAS